MNLEKYINTPIPIYHELNNFFNKEDKLTIFDVGCCEGEDTIKYSMIFPNCDIYSFEPHPENFTKTVNNLDKYGIKNATVFNIAISNSQSTIDFYLSEGHPNNLPVTEEWDYGNKSSSILPAKELHERYDWLRLNKSIKVKSTTLDIFCKEKNIKKIDLLHLDVQGAEILVLEGSDNIIDNIGLIWLEAETVELYKDQPLKNDVINYLSEKFEKIKEIDNYLSCDMLFVNKKLK